MALPQEKGRAEAKVAVWVGIKGQVIPAEGFWFITHQPIHDADHDLQVLLALQLQH